ncbi:MAG TPA: hypothetical protein DCS07_10840 [Bdellovibrionales bacterium]|nr:MAG: hypothetical protein A2Z97_07625 [Bdellovibrionales bacterium GWB1_52_6]OFZ04748.1 MAG: hypothetical protein A2X97_13565 [Bdellovibrionales bacterium GWA1_52_35]OFZ38176.1 MAG: hypothetical protein A2070_01300 [Bdellovibrionales bacterium GWC1_52_8]HAR43105.1 hypothetical protein [Bdellovibrionales bacterium]HCM39562.1 hypothetical protein [Bdellovibrionales bacterium]
MRQRSLQRSLSRTQVIEVAHQILYWDWQTETETYLFIGRTDGKNGAGFTAVIDETVVIVTVFRRKLKNWERKQGL